MKFLDEINVKYSRKQLKPYANFQHNIVNREIRRSIFIKYCDYLKQLERTFQNILWIKLFQYYNHSLFS